MTKQNYPTETTPPEPTAWHRPDGEIITCEEKIAVLQENMSEIEELCREALADALVMEVDEAQFREALAALVKRLPTPYAGR